MNKIGFLRSRLAAAKARGPLVAVAVAVSLALLSIRASVAQTLPDNLSDILQQLQQAKGGQQSGNTGVSSQQQQPQAQPQIIAAPQGPSGVTPPSRIELILSDRAGMPLHQFGYDVFAGLSQVTVPQFGSIQSYYLLGPGDELLINLRGQENDSYDVFVGNDGNVVLPKLPPLAAAGHSVAQFQADLQEAVKRAYISTQAFASVGQLRRVSVTVAGEVNVPGVKQLTGLSTPFDALILALGVKKSGSLRAIRIYRGTQVIDYDLYHVLLNDGHSAPLNLADGDRIVVPPVGRVAAAAGWVRRPGIYELAPGQQSISASSLLALAGGEQVRGAYRRLLLTTDGRGQKSPLELGIGSLVPVRDGDVLMVEPSIEKTIGQFELFGPTSLAGTYSLDAYHHKLSEVLRTPGVLGQSPYLLMGLISRKDPKTLQRHVVPISPQEILNGRTDFVLEDDDIVRIFDVIEAGRLSKAVDIYANRIDYLDQATHPSVSASAEESASDAYKRVVREAIFTSPNARSENQYSDQSMTPPVAQPESAELAALSNLSSVAATVPTSTNLAGMTGAVPNAGMTGIAPNFATSSNGALPNSSPSQGIPPNGSQNAVDDGQNAVESENSAVLQATAGPFVLDQKTSSQADIPITGELPNVATLGLQIGVDPAEIISVLADSRVSLAGAVRSPGTYLVGGSKLGLDELVGAAGGPTAWADLSGVELTRTVVDPTAGLSTTNRGAIDLKSRSLASIDVHPRDTFDFSTIYSAVGLGSVAVQGEVQNPGVFSLVRGERLSDLLKQAHGLTPQAYPYGAIFLRKSVAQQQRVGFQHEADDIERQLMMAAAQPAASSDTAASGLAVGATAFLQGLVDRLRTQPAAGRLTVIADPADIAAHPEADMILEPGDFLFIPQRPADVTVVGEVLNPGSFPQRPRLNVADYIDAAGGYGRYADESYVFVINPDGSSRKVSDSLFNFDSPGLAPGSLVVVPRDLQPIDWGLLTVEVTKVLGDLAISAASLSVISKN